MPSHSLIYFFHYFLKKPANQFFLSIAMRSFAIGMVAIFEPIYLYFFFNRSLSLTLLFFAANYGLIAFFSVFSARIMAKIGFDWSIFISHFFFFAYFLLLVFIGYSILFVPLAIVVRALGMSLFWPSYHTDFARFSQQRSRGRAVGKMNIFTIIPTVLSPAVGGLILTELGYPALFASVLTVLLASAIPLFFNQEKHEVYSDSFLQAWQRVLKKENQGTSLAFASVAVEGMVDYIFWPVFMVLSLFNYLTMGGLTSFALFAAALFSYYMGRVSDTEERPRLLTIGSILTSTSWIFKYFVVTPLSAVLAQAFYKISRLSAYIPFRTFFYEKAAQKQEQADEFIIYREIVINITRFFFLVLFAFIFLVVSEVRIGFIVAALVSLGFMFLTRPPETNNQ